MRSAFEIIAREEAEHAAISHAVGEWLWARLNAKERDQVAAEKRRAFSELLNELGTEPAPELVRRAGLPTRAQAEMLLTRLGQELLAA